MTDTSRFLLSPSAPTRPADWRWKLATTLRADREDPTGHDDGVRTAWQIQEENASPHAARVIERAIRALGPAVAEAYGFWLTGQTARDNNPPKPDDYTTLFGPLTPQALALAEMEALILAGKSPEKISKRTGLSPQAIKWYEALWFDVRSRLNRPSWISNSVIGTLHQGTLGTLLPALARAYGYYTRSTRIIATVVSGFDARATRSAASHPETFFGTDAMAAGGLKAALAIRLMPLTDRRTHARVVELHQESTKIAADAATLAGSDDENRIRGAVAVLAEQVKFRYGQAPPQGAPLRIAPHNEDAV